MYDGFKNHYLFVIKGRGLITFVSLSLRQVCENSLKVQKKNELTKKNKVESKQNKERTTANELKKREKQSVLKGKRENK